MLVDRHTIEVVRALNEVGATPVLLKGPVVAQWLYAGSLVRSYKDVDLLVAPGDRARSEEVLRAMGHVLQLGPTGRGATGERGPSHADTWTHAASPVSVDLHRCIHHTEHLPPQDVWDEIWRDHRTLRLREIEVAVPSPRVLALHVVLHVQAKDVAGSQAWTDLERAVVAVDAATWSGAAALARRWGVEREMGALLALVPGGDALASDLALATEPPLHLRRQHQRHAPALTRLRLQLAGAGWRGTVQVLAHQMAPARVRAAASSPDAHLVRAYGERFAALPRAGAEWLRCQRTSAHALRPSRGSTHLADVEAQAPDDGRTGRA